MDANEEHEHATADQPRVDVVLISGANEHILRGGYSHMIRQSVATVVLSTA